MRVHNEHETEVILPVGDASLNGHLNIPPDPLGVVIFAHGSGSGRHSPRNRAVAATLRAARLGTLLFDLLSADEEVIDLQTTRLRFDIALLAVRLGKVVQWMTAHEPSLPIGLFGASTGAGAALLAAAQHPEHVAAVVSRGGRPDLADTALPDVLCPSLFIVGSRDRQVIELNKLAMSRMRCERKIEIIAGASHLFEEPGALEQVSHLAAEWFVNQLALAPARHRSGVKISEGL